MTTELTPGQRAYDAYCAATGNRTYSGQPTLEWWALPVAIRHAWEQAGGQIRRDTLAEVTGLLRAQIGEAGL
ncbi:hypothetical protein [Deinococcus sp. PEB2-63]